MYTEAEMAMRLRHSKANLRVGAIIDAKHPAYEKPQDGCPKFISMKATAEKDLPKGTFIGAYSSDAIVFASNDDEEEEHEHGAETRTLRDYEIEPKDVGICINGNP